MEELKKRKKKAPRVNSSVYVEVITDPWSINNYVYD